MDLNEGSRFGADQAILKGSLLGHLSRETLLYFVNLD